MPSSIKEDTAFYIFSAFDQKNRTMGIVASVLVAIVTAIAGLFGVYFAGVQAGTSEERGRESERMRERERDSEGEREREREKKEKIERRIKHITNLKPGKTPGLGVIGTHSLPAKLHVGLFGDHSTGKTSLINSVLNAVVGVTKEHWHKIGPQNAIDPKPNTMYRALAKITDFLVLVDNRGFNLSDGFDDDMKAEMKAQLSKYLFKGISD